MRVLCDDFAHVTILRYTGIRPAFYINDMARFILFINLFIAVCISKLHALALSTVFAEWTVLNYTWDSTHTYDEYMDTNKFIPHNCALAGINVDKNGAIYVTVPRWRPGVPATLNKLEILPGSTEYTLTPFPSWDMQTEGQSGDLQNCQSMTIDSQNRMWVIETGRRNFLSPVAVDGAAGVWIIDLATGEILSKYYFPPEVASYNSSFVNDIVLDETRNLAYLTDANGNGGLIVYNHGEGTSRRYSSISTMSDPSYVMIIDGVNYGNQIFTTPSDGIAITEDRDALLYCAVQGTTLYRVPTAVLRNFSTSTAQIDAAVEVIGTKNPSDGIKYRNGVLYYGDLPNSNYHSLRIDATSYPNISADAESVPSDPETLRWVDTFALDLSDSSRLWFTTNRLDLFITYTMDFSGASGANFRVNVATTGNTESSSDDLSDPEVIIIACAGSFVVAVFAIGLFLQFFHPIDIKVSERETTSSARDGKIHLPPIATTTAGASPGGNGVNFV